MQIKCKHTKPEIHGTVDIRLNRHETVTYKILWCRYCGAIGKRDADNVDDWVRPKWQPAPEVEQCGKCGRTGVELIQSGPYRARWCKECRERAGRCLKCKAMRHDCSC